ncbi:DUF2284 domain-containing protein [Sedimentibacter sp. zth1]|uniref:DUF2284 domain-containing protein n=1 Tax=Sedimentibacter sp. zth1 TaxID=2816908 RepID=UPI001A93363E|nr:DUF2284 domain-containing protein [Sedimentibacter sp. zth1]QSX05853.1 DUF2284 domain-containing protein [Sedimentibacter sp. zth1]
MKNIEKLYKLEVIKNRIDVLDYIKKYYDSEVFFGYCQGCNLFSKLWSCPPYNFSTKDYILNYKYLHVFGTKVFISKDNFQNDKHNKDILEILNYVRRNQEKELLEFEHIYKDSISLNAGSCLLCKTCTRLNGNVCIHKDKMRYSLESLGCDVQKTALELLGIEIKWSKDGKILEYYTLVSGFLTNKNLDINLKGQ